jgi:hypothetical protein
MSLITTASPWSNEETNISKKRIPTIRRTIKKQNLDTGPVEYNSENKLTENSELDTNTIESTQKKQEDRNERINQMINKMTSVTAENDGNRLADFVPMSNPAIQKRTDYENEPGDDPDEPVQVNPARIFKNQVGPPIQPNYDSANLGNFGNYQNVYSEKPALPIRSINGERQLVQQQNPFDNKLMEKLNYMIHMLEEQQNEKTSNITEEFLLYMFLGIFIIFIVDSFARAGKYTR